jgi:NAD+ synthase (glutamine-hydrolysing)
MFLANDGNYRELRYFTPWSRIHDLDKHSLPPSIALITGR